MKCITQNIKYFRRQKLLTQKALAEILEIKTASIGAYEEGRAFPKLPTLAKMADLFDTSIDELVQKDLTGSDGHKKKNIKSLVVTIDDEDNGFIELVPIKASAGYTGGYNDPEYITELPKFNLPILPKGGNYRAFEIAGESMTPIQSGSIIVGKYIDSIQEIKNGKTYVLVTKTQGVVYKRIFNYIEEKGTLCLVSDNKIYRSYELPPEEVNEIWEAKAYISVEFPDINTSQELSKEELLKIISELQTDVEALKRNYGS